MAQSRTKSPSWLGAGRWPHGLRWPVEAAILLALVAGGGPRVRAEEHQAPAQGESGAAAEPAKPAAEGGAKSADGATTGEGAPSSAPQYRLDKPLNGYFDLSTLLSAQKTARYRYEFKDLTQTLSTPDSTTWVASLSFVVEFGKESGLAELQRNESRIKDALRQVIEQYTPQQLLTVSGKGQLKEDLIQVMNQCLTTARVRTIYLTDFIVGQG